MSKKILIINALICSLMASSSLAFASNNDDAMQFYFSVDTGYGWMTGENKFSAEYNKDPKIPSGASGVAAFSATSVTKKSGITGDDAKFNQTYPNIGLHFGMSFLDGYMQAEAGISYQSEWESKLSLVGASRTDTAAPTFKTNAADISNPTTSEKLEKDPTKLLYPAKTAADNLNISIQTLEYTGQLQFNLLPDSIISPFAYVILGGLHRKVSITSDKYLLASPSTDTAQDIKTHTISFDGILDFTGGIGAGCTLKFGEESGVRLNVGYVGKYIPQLDMKDQTFSLKDDAVLDYKLTAKADADDATNWITYTDAMKNGTPKNNVFTLSKFKDEADYYIKHSINVSLEFSI